AVAVLYCRNAGSAARPPPAESRDSSESWTLLVDTTQRKGLDRRSRYTRIRCRGRPHARVAQKRTRRSVTADAELRVERVDFHLLAARHPSGNHHHHDEVGAAREDEGVVVLRRAGVVA